MVSVPCVPCRVEPRKSMPNDTTGMGRKLTVSPAPTPVVVKAASRGVLFTAPVGTPDG